MVENVENAALKEERFSGVFSYNFSMLHCAELNSGHQVVPSYFLSCSSQPWRHLLTAFLLD